MGKWTDAPMAGAFADDDVLLMADVSEPVGTRDRRATLGSLRTVLGAGITVGVTQASHGLVVGDVVRFDGADYVQATADAAANAEAVGVVTSVPDSGTFAYQTAGVVATLSGLTPGELYYLQDDGSLGTSAGTVDKPVLIATSATTAVLILAISGAGGGGASDFLDLTDTPGSYAGQGGKLVAVNSGATALEFVTGGGSGGNDYYDLQLGFLGVPDAGAVDVVLSARAVTIDDADPGEVFVGTNPTSAATITINKNGVSVGSISITTGGVASWTVGADIVLTKGDRLSLVAPSPADATLAGVLVAFRGAAG